MLRYTLLFARTCGICQGAQLTGAQGGRLTSSFNYNFRKLHVTCRLHLKVKDFGTTFQNLCTRKKSYFRPLYVGTVTGSAWLLLQAIPERDTAEANDISKSEIDLEQFGGQEDFSMLKSKVTKSREKSVVLSGLVFEIGLGLTGLLCAWKSGLPVFGKGFHISPYTCLQGVFATIPLLGFVYLIEKLPFKFLKETASQTQRIIAEVFLPRSSTEIGLLCVCTGIAEEIAFRSFLYSWLIARIHLSVPQGLILSSCVFGLFHPVSPAYVCIASLAGSYFSFLYIVSGNNVFVPAITHAFYDYVILEISRYQLSRQKGNFSNKDRLD
ncbi:hypothetical protein GpartN1_g3809.t1 [Galdieria partita]|uniref:CAAX prenyl protease 2/Lysostaphin resistance protein A-like domain-containing protein n=1 Tax=Galdieria partita TaxID=83374 RepID=A0A9C7PWE4_9RHOD|nr:hypothetical protein GpartN1_g3809.t1 [Galdieria partita]